MRESLFRGKPKNKADYQLFAQIWKDNCKNGFVFGSLVVSEGKFYICVAALCAVNSLINNGITTMIEVIPETVGQYTGLTDKNGKKIFERDIVKYCETKGVINFGEGCYAVKDINSKNNPALDIVLNGYKCEIKVIGNIYDNPELLKGGCCNGIHS